MYDNYGQEKNVLLLGAPKRSCLYSSLLGPDPHFENQLPEALLHHFASRFRLGDISQKRGRTVEVTCGKVSSSLLRPLAGGREWLWAWRPSSSLSLLPEEAESGSCRSSSHNMSSVSDAACEPTAEMRCSTSRGFTPVTMVTVLLSSWREQTKLKEGESRNQVFMFSETSRHI